MLAGKGSRMTAASSLPRCSKVCLRASRSLKGRTMVSWAKLAGIPALSGEPRVRAPEPALIRREST